METRDEGESVGKADGGAEKGGFAQIHFHGGTLPAFAAGE